MRSQVDKKEAEFPFDSLEVPAIIVVMGLPFTVKKEVAGAIGRWARYPVLIIDNFLDVIAKEAGYNGESIASSREEAERLHRVAFDALCSVARQHLDSQFSGCKCVVIKSPRICSPYELQQLVYLTEHKKSGYNSTDIRSPLILVECQLRNEFWWKGYCSNSGGIGKWYEPNEWKEIEKAKEDYNPHAFDHQLVQLLNHPPPPPRVRRLVLDPLDDINIPDYWWNGYKWVGEITHSFATGIKFLLTAGEEELKKEIPLTVELPKLRRYLMEKKIAAASASPKRSKYFCVGGSCVFKYSETPLELDGCCCGVCKEPLVVGGEAGGYRCYFCVLGMHKSCAEMPHFNPPSSSFGALESALENHIDRCPEKQACDSCIEAGQLVFSDECASCCFQTHLRSSLIPTVIRSPDFHPHIISLQFLSSDLNCKGCGWGTHSYSRLQSRYGCNICETYYHPYCPFWPKEFSHHHGGHQHVMNLMLSHAVQEEDYWCDLCYHDINPQVWFYSCHHCPYYMAHLHCTLGSLQYYTTD